MPTDVDMSGRIEETNRPTAIALANDVNECILISERDKRAVIETLRRQKPERERKLIHIRIFSTLLYLLLRDHFQRLSVVTIDLEYPGYERDIKDWVMTLCRRNNVLVHHDQIEFHRVGKKSPSHLLAYQTYKGQKPPNRRITAQEILRILGK